MLSIERKISLVRIFILCIANTIIITLSSAQLPYIKQFSTQDGLCGGLVYYTMQDSKGYIWSACKQGISMFNGHEFKSFTIKDGLPSNDVWRIDEDEFGRLWMSTFGGICYYEDGKIKKIPYRSTASESLTSNHKFWSCCLSRILSITNLYNK